jgi:hypothetical protein
MNNTLTANQLGGRAIGSIFFAAFGALWLLLSLYARELLTVASVSGVLFGALILLFAAFYLMRQAKRYPKTPDDPAMGRAFAWINAIQWTAVAVVAITFAKLHIDAYVISAIAAIVGLHMFPLARLFRYRMHYATGALLVAWAAASAVLVPTEQMQSVAAFGTGVVLWLSAAVTLAIALYAARQTAQPQAC